MGVKISVLQVFVCARKFSCFFKNLISFRGGNLKNTFRSKMLIVQIMIINAYAKMLSISFEELKIIV